jgi:hypothetical protein
MLNHIQLSNDIIDYKNQNVNNPDYTGFEIYRIIIPTYIFNNIYVMGIFTNPEAIVVSSEAVAGSVSEISLSSHYNSLNDFGSDFEQLLLGAINFSTPIGILNLSFIISGKLTSDLNNAMSNITDYTYENIVLSFSNVIINNIKTNSKLVGSNALGSYVSNLIQ